MKGYIALFFSMSIAVFGWSQDYEDVTDVVGIDHTYPFTFEGFFGGGVSFMDFNNDGWDDLTFATQKNEDIYFLENSNGTFIPRTFSGLLNNCEAKQVLWIDFDNDGDKDFYITCQDAANRLYENNGNLEFTDITVEAGLDLISEHTFGASFGDVNNDGYLDLYVTNRWIIVQERYSILYLNNGDKTFTDATVAAQITKTPPVAFTSTFIDYNKDGHLDIFTAMDKYYGNILFENNGNETFTDKSVESGFHHPLDAMCVTPGDFDNDDDIDIYVTNTPLEGNHFFRNNGDNTFDTIEIETGLVVHGFCWGSNFLDVENDGDLDLYISAQYTPDSINSSHLFINDGIGKFNISNPRMPNDTLNSFSNAVGDYDKNGFPDIAVNNYQDTPSRLWRNTNTNGNWLKIKLLGTVSNRDAFGSKIEVYSGGRKQLRYTYANEGFIAQNANHEIFGLGNETQVDSVIISWLSGIKDTLKNVAANQEILIIEGDHPVGIDDAYPEISKFQITVENERIRILSKHTASLKLSIQLFSIDGEIVYDINSIILPFEEFLLSTNTLPNGVYLLQLIGDNVKTIKKVDVF